MKGSILMNSVVDIVEHRKNIVSLWNECFDDSRDYIEFFLDRCSDKICLGHIESSSIKSMLFLLNGEINGYSCKYIYAACTEKKARCRGLMGSLIEYAKEYCRSHGVDFIFLVPGEESLYSYYSRFGFIPAMKRYDREIKGRGNGFCPRRTTDIGAIAERRLSMLKNIKSFRFDLETTEYTVAEFLKTGGEIYSENGKNGFLAFCMRDGKNLTVKELLLDFDSSFINILDLFEKIGAENVYIHAPLVYNSTNIGDNCTKCGMLYPLSDNAKKCTNELGTLYAGMYLD